MEYLESINDPAKTIDESKIKYTNVLERPDIVFGAPFIDIDYVGFDKYGMLTHDEIKKYDDLENNFNVFRTNTSGVFLKFKVKSNEIVIKARLYRRFDFLKMTLWCSSGLDVYEIEDGKYNHSTVIAPKTGQNIFCYSFSHDPQSEVLIYLPLYNEFLDFYIGTSSEIEAVDTVLKPAVAFYGNSITQGAAASRSGNCFVNVFSRITGYETYNYSITSCCRGLKSVARTLGLLNLKAIVIDYSRNAESVSELQETYEAFYKELRKYHQNTPIVFMTIPNFKEVKSLYSYNEPIIQAYENALRRNENVMLLNQMDLFESDEYDLCSLDGTHYTDYGMYRVAVKLAEMLGLS